MAKAKRAKHAWERGAGANRAKTARRAGVKREDPVKLRREAARRAEADAERARERQRDKAIKETKEAVDRIGERVSRAEAMANRTQIGETAAAPALSDRQPAARAAQTAGGADRALVPFDHRWVGGKHYLYKPTWTHDGVMHQLGTSSNPWVEATPGSTGGLHAVLTFADNAWTLSLSGNPGTESANKKIVRVGRAAAGEPYRQEVKGGLVTNTPGSGGTPVSRFPGINLVYSCNNWIRAVKGTWDANGNFVGSVNQNNQPCVAACVPLFRKDAVVWCRDSCGKNKLSAIGAAFVGKAGAPQWTRWELPGSVVTDVTYTPPQDETGTGHIDKTKISSGLSFFSACSTVAAQPSVLLYTLVDQANERTTYEEEAQQGQGGGE